MHHDGIAGLGLKTQDGEHQQLRELFSVLSNNDSLRVFELASQGTIASDATLEKMKISRGQYYKKLKELRNLSLVMKDSEGVYRHTILGEVIYQNQVKTLRAIAADADLFELMVKFTLKNKSSNKTFEQVVREITRDIIANSDPGLWSLSELRLFQTMEQYFSRVENLISGTKNELHLAARSLDLPMIDALVRAAQAGAKISMIYTGWRGFYSKSNFDPLEELLITASKNYAAAKVLMTSPLVSIKRMEIPYGFVVSDNKCVALEIADHKDSQSFFAGIGLESEELATKLVSYYEKLLSDAKKIEAS